MSDQALATSRLPELIDLEPAAQQRVLQLVAVKGGYCDGCGGTEFEVGEALRLGFLFIDEDEDSYMVGLTCRNPDCGLPRTGIVLHYDEFL